MKQVLEIFFTQYVVHCCVNATRTKVQPRISKIITTGMCASMGKAISACISVLSVCPFVCLSIFVCWQNSENCFMQVS